MEDFKSKLGHYALGVLAHLLLLLAWYLFVRLGEVPKFVMPSPADTFGALTMGNYNWWVNIRVTATEIFGGYALALVVGVGLALVFTWSRLLESLMLPLLITLNMIPKVALGPLIIVWFKYGVFPNTLMAFSIAVFPILLTTARGLGYLMLQVQVTLDTPAMFMAVILITLLGMALYGLVLLLERLMVVKDARVAG
jgi:NitT/TauT family transport system permease protein